MFTLTLRMGRLEMPPVKTEWDVLAWRRRMGLPDASYIPRGTPDSRRVQLNEDQMRSISPTECDTVVFVDLVQFRPGELNLDAGLKIEVISPERAVEMFRTQITLDLAREVERLTARVAELEGGESEDH